MLDVRTIREDAAAFDAAMARRGRPPEAARLLSLDDARRGAIAASEAGRERRNAITKAYGAARARGDVTAAEGLQADSTALKEAAPALEAAVREAEAAMTAALLDVPNVPMPDVPDGADERGNVEVRRWGTPRAFPDGSAPRSHDEVGEALGLMDFRAAGAMSGSRFVVLRGRVARLHRALGQWMLDLHVGTHGYEEVEPPLLVREDALVGTAQFPKFRDDQFAAGDAHWLIPTAEVPLTNLVRETILDADALPLRFAALTPCFRQEAGAAGRDTRGMMRQHQFAKVEMVSVTTPEASGAEHERMVGCAEAVLQGLGLPYRVMHLCAGDMGFAAQRTYDLEVWLPSQGAYREISSCSTCGDFQARRMGARHRPAGGGRPEPVHTLNGSGVAVGRALVAVMENHQRPDGGVDVPEVLRPYMGGIDGIG